MSGNMEGFGVVHCQAARVTEEERKLSSGGDCAWNYLSRMQNRIRQSWVFLGVLVIDVGVELAEQ